MSWIDRAVWAGGWHDDPAETEESAILSRLLALNLEPVGEGSRE